MGEPSTGKSTSLRTLDYKETFIITPNVKDFPFPGAEVNYTNYDSKTGKGNVYRTEELDNISAIIKHVSSKLPHVKQIVLEDFSHYLTHRVLGPDFAGDTGYNKWNRLGASVQAALFTGLDKLRDDLIILIIHHTDLHEDGKVKEQTAGKLMDNLIKVSSWYTVILHSHIKLEKDVRRYVFQTNEVAPFLAKSPPGMFADMYISNNMQKVLDDMRLYRAGKPQYPVHFID